MENGKNILVTVPVEETHVQKLQEAGPGCAFRFKAGTALPSFQRAKLPFENLIETDPVTQEDIDWADIILGNVKGESLHGSEKL